MPFRLQHIKQRTAPWAWWLVVLMVLAPMGPHAMGAVLCIETDGSFALEQATGLGCSSDAVAPKDDAHGDQAFAATTPHPDEHCDDCIDVVLPSGADADCASFVTTSTTSAQVVLPLVAVLTSDAAPAAVVAAAARAADDALIDTSPIAPLRGVVLLI